MCLKCVQIFWNGKWIKRWKEYIKRYVAKRLFWNNTAEDDGSFAGNDKVKEEKKIWKLQKITKPWLVHALMCWTEMYSNFFHRTARLLFSTITNIFQCIRSLKLWWELLYKDIARHFMFPHSTTRDLIALLPCWGIDGLWCTNLKSIHQSKLTWFYLTLPNGLWGRQRTVTKIIIKTVSFKKMAIAYVLWLNLKSQNCRNLVHKRLPPKAFSMRTAIRIYIYQRTTGPFMILYQNGNTYRNMIVKQKAIIAQFVSFNSFSVIGSFLIELKIYIKREPFLISLFFFLNIISRWNFTFPPKR